MKTTIPVPKESLLKTCVTVADGGQSSGYQVQDMLVPQCYGPYIDFVMVSYRTILDRIEKLALDISSYYQGETVHMICILKGSRRFFHHLIETMNRIRGYSCGMVCPTVFEQYVRVKSYSNTQSTGKVHVISEDLSVLEAKHVLIVEDIVDSGKTLQHFTAFLRQYSPKSVRVATLLEKRTPTFTNLRADFVGFSIPDYFVVGFSLDYNEIFRDLDHLCVLNKAGIDTFAEQGPDAALALKSPKTAPSASRS